MGRQWFKKTPLCRGLPKITITSYETDQAKNEDPDYQGQWEKL
jgi:hypothetical protein